MGWSAGPLRVTEHVSVNLRSLKSLRASGLARVFVCQWARPLCPPPGRRAAGDRSHRCAVPE